MPAGYIKSEKAKLHINAKRLTMEQFGNYTCEAHNHYEGYCRQKVVEIELQGRQNI